MGVSAGDSRPGHALRHGAEKAADDSGEGACTQEGVSHVCSTLQRRSCAAAEATDSKSNVRFPPHIPLSD